MEKRRPRNKQQAQCGADRARRARRVRAAAPSRPRLPVHGLKGGTAAASQSPAAPAPPSAPAPAATRVEGEAPVPEKPPLRCAFGATRAGALLGRLRLHLQTERFLAVRRDDAMWEAGCLVASVALGDLVAALSESEMQAPLSGRAPAVAGEALPPVLGAAPPGAGAGQACGEGAR